MLKNNQGSLVIETLLAMFVLSTITFILIPIFNQLNQKLEEIERQVEMKQMLFTHLKHHQFETQSYKLHPYKIESKKGRVCVIHEGLKYETCATK
ncbi:competence type IV pilus minor pilin ComGE [Staphylococcus massiliensis]|uniref:Type II secretion system protein n=1 Tax=Staphylococcus massiliensis S46 TaxID=1229783 RepID=K9AUZ5_9STAP|nr:competence type IV pilus minor pilin ComGE [Staphylococcus massiliensis]EKU49871.1 hypothetical protein C273_03215 [Staphylococcus massiliensis S46]MCG3398975.1 hypothetical protein [Staphylococcus massiliensis]MCG3401023.1 hypothetical protein [Staphylococcus massiliensis]MCG3413024.1 hypothetical protein [Staphylococcus massiliensis]POA02036.1 hypothetical protein CD133_00100 [Staphylococcus massiliensis CCUG 55927]